MSTIPYCIIVCLLNVLMFVMNKIKECACTGVSVNYTPQNNYSTFPDGAMTSYELTLNFNELEPVFNDEYQNDNDASIGF